jgi:8-oxo-dGTP pyrophosphatase MutT (NUDIX family)
MQDRFKLVAAVYVLLRRDDEILMLQRKNTGYHDGDYSLVAGHVDGDEPLTAAASREALEEAGVRIDPADLTLKLVMHRRQADERLEFFFEARRWSGPIRNAEPDKCGDLSWFALDALPPATIPYIRAAIDACRRGQTYAEFWRPTGS